MENRYLFLGICFIMALISFLICFFLVKLILKISKKKKIFDYFDERKLNKEPRPRIGGVAIFVSYFFVIYLFVFFTFLHKGNFLEDIIGISPFKIFLYSGAIFCIFILGLFDDFSPLKAKYKLFIEFAVSIPICIIGFNIKFISVPFGIGHIDLGLFSLPITILWIVGVINAINLIDGLDGLGAGVIAISSLAMIVILVLEKNYTYALLLVPLFGGIVGFLPYNIYPSKIFMGDSGSLFSGAILGTIMLGTPHKASFGVALMIPFAILALPILDTLLAFIRRILKRKSPFSPDADHIHHRFLHKGYGEAKTVKILLLISTFFSILAILIHSCSQKMRSLLFILLFLLILGLLGYLKYIRVGNK